MKPGNEPGALEKAFELYPEVRLIVVAHLCGSPGKMDEIRRIPDKHGVLIVKDAAESLGVTCSISPNSVLTKRLEKNGAVQIGLFGDYGCISLNGDNVLERVRYLALCNKAPKIAA